MSLWNYCFKCDLKMSITSLNEYECPFCKDEFIETVVERLDADVPTVDLDRPFVPSDNNNSSLGLTSAYVISVYVYFKSKQTSCFLAEFGLRLLYKPKTDWVLLYLGYP